MKRLRSRHMPTKPHLDLEKMEKKLDKVLSKETKETLLNWYETKKKGKK